MQHSQARKRWKIVGVILLSLFIFLNVIAALHAYRFTHFSDPAKSRTSEQLSTLQKVKILFTSISNPRPQNKQLPQRPYLNVAVQSNKLLRCWWMKADQPRGSILVFHGYGGEKSSMLDKAEVFLKLNYNVLLVDFMGAGGSEGNQTTIGFKEAEEVKDCFEFVHRSGEKNIHLFGTSMGAVSIMKAINDYGIQPKTVLLECPFGTMYQTVCTRFDAINVPQIPMAPLLTFWGGVQNGFWAFSHNPENYAKTISCPTLLLYGAKDQRVTAQETETIFANLQGPKTLIVYPLAGHENYLRKYENEWVNDVRSFLLNH